MKKLIFAALLVIGGYAKTFAQVPDVIVSDKAGWHKMGETTVDFKTETDEIMVIGANRFQSLKIKVDKEPIDLISFVVYFDSGDKQDVKIGQQIKTMGESRVVALNGGERTVKKVVFKYKTLPNSQDKKAKVELWGLKTNTDKK